MCTSTSNNESLRSVVFDEAHSPTCDELAVLLFEDENDPRSNSYKRILVKPKISWWKVFAAVVVPIVIIVSWCCIAARADIGTKNIWIIAGVLLALYIAVMLKHIVVFSVKLYQLFAPASIRCKCRFEPSCSAYMILAIQKYGLPKGLIKGINRLMRCNRNNGGFDMP